MNKSNIIYFIVCPVFCRRARISPEKKMMMMMRRMKKMRMIMMRMMILKMSVRERREEGILVLS